jgi:uncharacterized protein (TIGR02757 family)
VIKERARVKEILEELYAKYNRRELIKPDPLQYVYKYGEPRDMEIAGFLAAALAYGRVQQIEKSVGELLRRMGASPYEFVRGFAKRQRQKLVGFKHRFTTGPDISDLLELLREVVEQWGSIERFFAEGYDPGDKTVVPALSRFCEELVALHAARHGGEVGRGLKYLLASPLRGSASKRLNLFLRWMVRDDEVDAGLWKSVDKAKLVVPVDVHMGRLSGILGFHDRKTVSLRTALRITESFAELEPGDPVKYDFALSRVGIVDDCSGRRRAECDCCRLLEFCSRRENWADEREGY